jgi:hypothetical protein
MALNAAQTLSDNYNVIARVVARVIKLTSLVGDAKHSV